MTSKLSPKNGDGPIHQWFGLSYASYLVVPRLVLQELPHAWQEQFVKLLNEATDMGAPDPYGRSAVSYRDVNGRFIKMDHWQRYRRGTVEQALMVDKIEYGEQP